MDTPQNSTITFSVPIEVAQKVSALARFEEGDRTTWFLKLFALYIAYSRYMDERGARVTDRIIREEEAKKSPRLPEEESRLSREAVKKLIEEARRKGREEEKRMTPEEREAMKREEREMDEIVKTIHDGRKASRVIKKEAGESEAMKSFLDRFTKDFLCIEQTYPEDRVGS